MLDWKHTNVRAIEVAEEINPSRQWQDSQILLPNQGAFSLGINHDWGHLGDIPLLDSLLLFEG